MIKSLIKDWLFPEHEVLEKKYQNLVNRVQEARWWLGAEFPETALVTRWIYSEHTAYCGFRTDYAVRDKPWIHQISDLREYMRTNMSRDN